MKLQMDISFTDKKLLTLGSLLLLEIQRLMV